MFGGTKATRSNRTESSREMTFAKTDNALGRCCKNDFEHLDNWMNLDREGWRLGCSETGWS